MKKITLILLSMLLIIPTFIGCSQKKESVVIYSSAEDYRNEATKKLLDEKFPDLDITIQQIPTGNAAAKLKAEGTNTEADIVLGLETASMIPLLDNFADLSNFKKDHYLDEFVPKDNRYLMWEKADGCFIVNTQVLEEKGLPTPTTFEDLLKPEYKGLIAMPNPKTSNTGYMFLNNLVTIMGKDQAFSYIDKLQENVKQFTESGSGPVKMLSQGEIAIGLGMVMQASLQISKGSPLKIILQETGIPYNVTSFGIIKGKETKQSVIDVFTFLNEEANRYDKEQFAPGRILKDQETKMENYPTDIVPAQMTDIYDVEFKNELLSKWKY